MREDVPDLERRFSGVQRLYGEVAAQQFQAAHVCVVGVGGVGSWVVEALTRNRIGRLTMIDLDMVAESNTNRQIQALEGAYGKAKIEVMAERIQAINPECRIHCVEDFVTLENVALMLAENFSIVIDAIDQARVKAAMIAHCKRQDVPIVTVGAAGGQTDPTRIRRADLALTTQDPLLARVRSQLRREYAFPKAPKKFGIAAIYSGEALRYPAQACDSNAPQGLSCAGFGSSVCVTAGMGLAASAAALEILGSPPKPASQGNRI
ncbi:MAG: tRNA threonylcarbamoyladenosine dehydratase [Zoogloeaceae bacterium]|jgi:tRNA A37 threonylcarbamoyladenosine dehydratase|nr:tRNA threonylcarbamoyladenosine dehydratase [Zoogloeaceae bacterium]